jgi:hypothetical protein
MIIQDENNLKKQSISKPQNNFRQTNKCGTEIPGNEVEIEKISM